MQTLRAFQLDIPMQHPKVRSRRRSVEWPVQLHFQRESVQRYPDLLVSAAVPPFSCNCVIEFIPLVRKLLRRSSIFNFTGWNRSNLLELYRPSSVERTFSARSTLVKGFCRSCAPGSRTLCCTTISSV